MSLPPRTAAQKILARAAGESYAEEGRTLVVPVDCALFHDASGPLILEALKRAGRMEAAFPERVCVVFDHGQPAASALAANRQSAVREYARSLQASGAFFADSGEGICHQVLFESGRVRAGHVVVGADSHTCTLGAVGAFAIGAGATDLAAVLLTGSHWLQVPPSFKVEVTGRLPAGVGGKDAVLALIGLCRDSASDCVLEYSGPGLDGLDMESRLTLCNMAVEASAATALMPGPGLGGDEAAAYRGSVRLDLDRLSPLVACPHGFDRIVEARELGDVLIQQAFVGSCTNGRLSDLRAAAAVLRGRRVHPECRLIIVPASRPVMQAALREGLLDVFLAAGAMLEHPNCGPCLGAHQGVPADGEACIASSSRNYRGRMGNPNASIYLASPATVAASAVAGRVADPRALAAVPA